MANNSLTIFRLFAEPLIGTDAITSHLRWRDRRSVEVGLAASKLVLRLIHRITFHKYCQLNRPVDQPLVELNTIPEKSVSGVSTVLHTTHRSWRLRRMSPLEMVFPFCAVNPTVNANWFDDNSDFRYRLTINLHRSISLGKLPKIVDERPVRCPYIFRFCLIALVYRIAKQGVQDWIGLNRVRHQERNEDGKVRATQTYSHLYYERSEGPLQQEKLYHVPGRFLLGQKPTYVVSKKESMTQPSLSRT